MTEKTATLPTSNEMYLDEKEGLYKHRKVEVPPVRRHVTVYSEKRTGLFAKPWELREVKRVEKFQYFLNGEWKDMSTHHEFHTI